MEDLNPQVKRKILSDKTILQDSMSYCLRIGHFERLEP
jgi:hypothetical protein